MRISAFRSCSLRKHPAVSSTFLLCATRSSDTSELILSFRVVAEPLQSFRVVSEPLPSFIVVFQPLQSLFRASSELHSRLISPSVSRPPNPSTRKFPNYQVPEIIEFPKLSSSSKLPSSPASCPIKSSRCSTFEPSHHRN